MDILKIMEHLPHRYPFLLLDRVLELVPHEKAVALKNVTINEPYFQGHFPVSPIMPGVLILEAMAQAGCVLTYVTRKDEIKNALIYLVAMDNVKFRRPVVPGDQLLFTVQAVRERTRSIKMSGIAEVDGKMAVQATLMAQIGEKPGETK